MSYTEKEKVKLERHPLCNSSAPYLSVEKLLR